MSAPTVLVAFASQSGSTAGIAQAITAELRAASLAVECLPASEVTSLEPYTALILGSGVFVRKRASDGGGFLARHARDLPGRSVWLFCAGPIGRGHVAEDAPTLAPTPADCAVMDVARAIGARGAAAFGAGAPCDASPEMIGRPIDMPGVRAWAQEIARELTTVSLAEAS